MVKKKIFIITIIFSILLLLIILFDIFDSFYFLFFHYTDCYRSRESWINFEVKYIDNTFEIKNCDNFDWTNVEIGLYGFEYEYGYIIEKIEPNELYLIEFNEFVNVRGVFDEIGTPFDGKKLKLVSTEPSYGISIYTDESYNYATLFIENVIYKSIDYRKIDKEYKTSKIIYYGIRIVAICILLVIIIILAKRIKEKRY